MNNRIVAPCGIVCTECPAYLATKSNNLEKLQEIAEMWSSEDHRLESNDIVCEGCFSERVHTFCAECEVRECSSGKGYRVCSVCAMYPCDRLNELWSSFTTTSVDECRDTLQAERQRLTTQARI